jgi:hypothetical protein
MATLIRSKTSAPSSLKIVFYINPLMAAVSYVSQLHFAYEVCMVLSACALTSINQPIFVIVKCGVLFEVRTESLNI